MTRTSTLVLALALLVNFALPAWAGDDLKTIKKQMADAWDKLHSIKAKLTTKSYWPDEDGTLLEAKRTGTYEHLKHKQVNLFRMEQEGKSFVPQGPGTGADTIKRKTLMVNDGEYEYQLTETPEGQEASKWRFDQRKSPNPRTLLRSLAEVSTLVLVGQEENAGKKVYVIESIPKSAQQKVSRVVYHFRADGIMLKQESYDRKGDLRFVMELSDVEINVNLDPERFEFKPPPGVPVEDVTPK